MENIKKMEEPTDRTCEKCGSRWSSSGGRYAASWPARLPGLQEPQEIATVVTAAAAGSRGRRDPPPKSPAIPEDHGTCEKCGSPMVLRRGRFGPFIRLLRLPECRNTKKIAMDKEGKITTQEADLILDETCRSAEAPGGEDGRFGEFTLLQLSRVQVHQAEEVGLDCRARAARSHRRAPLPPRPRVLRLQQLPQVRFS